MAVKQPGHEADQSLPTSAKVNNDWSYTSAPTMRSWCALGQLYLHILCINIQLIHHRKQGMLPLERQISECCRGE